MRKNCKFCGSLDTSLVILTTPLSYVIANYYPMGTLSLLAIPRRHVKTITELTFEESADLMQITALAVNNIKLKLKPEGINIFLNEGKIAGQSIKHLHFHIVARNTGDGLENFRCNNVRKAITMEQINTIKELF
jgi:diadenosine tetraphosphate (Ap4A) HIT family hydrolase